jgi:hypothetical protein
MNNVWFLDIANRLPDEKAAKGQQRQDKAD